MSRSSAYWNGSKIRRNEPRMTRKARKKTKNEMILCLYSCFSCRSWFISYFTAHAANFFPSRTNSRPSDNAADARTGLVSAVKRLFSRYPS